MQEDFRKSDHHSQMLEARKTEDYSGIAGQLVCVEPGECGGTEKEGGAMSLLWNM